ncbi:DHH family phosphoesterase [Ructibacterium gallinarum]|uniref:Cyclic-di-AMP phosphodiesterase n=1 Tax=Ructibacterium gallinarum TaxID=2779355 RepID=A0A9D5R997_9FIRM|nr:DHH family phosphoesterase [Ructibacterium gallinarum]MBE5040269.1 DHH family phosphoesterase [Ructibacterium gallinarum]
MSNTTKGVTAAEKSFLLRNSIIVAACFFAFGLLTFLFAWNRCTEMLFLALMEMIAAVIAGAAGIFAAKKRKRVLAEKLENFAFCIESTTKASIMNFPSPMVVTTAGGAVQWYNLQFADMVGRSNLFGEYLQDLFPELQFSRFVEDENPTPEEYSYKDKDYIITGSAVRINQETVIDTMVGLYFTDCTAVRNLQRKLDDKRIVVCSVCIDNYDEVFKGTPNSSHGALIGSIEHCVNTWVDRGDGVVIRYERDKFIVLFEEAHFKVLLKEKFSVLNEVKKIQQGNRFPVTISIGVGRAGTDLRENEQLSRDALDMALGRGGDQAVVKTIRGFQFYGAKSREIEKSTKVKARVVAHALRDLADQASNVIIMGHRSGDADSVGAAVGIFRALFNRKVDVYIAVDRTRNNARMILDGLLEKELYQSRIIHEDRALNLIDSGTLLVIVDTHRPSMVDFKDVLKNVKDIVLIDHHRRSEDFIENTALTYHEPYASSSSEMVTEMLQYISDGMRLEPYEAEALYCGIYMDTKGFTFKTGVRTFEAASCLRKLGADPVNVRRLFRNDLNVYIQRSRIISRAKVYRKNIAIAVCDDLGEDTQIVVAQAADELLNIRGIEAAFVLASVGNRIIISGRSLDSVNVQVILEKLGGGGHITIAGAQLRNNSLKLAEMRLCAAIDEVVFEEAPMVEA